MNTLEHWNQTSKRTKFNFSEDKLSQPLWSKASRYKRSTKQCPQDQILDNVANHCCRKCPAGQYHTKPCAASGQNPTCEVCQDNHYLKLPNYRHTCQSCTKCDNVKQVEVLPCNATHDRECSCKEEFYVNGEECYPCKKCLNRDIKKNCTKTTDTICGDCLPNFYEQNNECHHCNQSDKDCKETPPTCTPVCVPLPRAQEYYVVFGVFPLLLVFVLAGLFIYKYKWKKGHSLGGNIYTVCQEEPTISPKTYPGESILVKFEEPQVLEPLFASISQGHLPSVLQKGCALYDIIDCVPVKRWKEFMRNLELPDNEIERVEMEVCNFRDQQYEMLRRWCQLKTASMESVYRALDRMYLTGCLEELKSKIERYS